MKKIAARSCSSARRRLYSSCWNNDREGGLDFCDKGMQFAFTTGGDLFVSDTLVREPRLVHGRSLTARRTAVSRPAHVPAPPQQPGLQASV